MAMNETTTIRGNVTDEPVLRPTKTGSSWTTFTVAVNHGSGENRKATFIRVKVWNSDFAENFAENTKASLKKGTRVTVTGRAGTEAWIDKQTGEPRSALVINADEVDISLRYATAEVSRNEREGGFNGAPASTGYGNRGSYGGSPAPAASVPAEDDPFAVALDDAAF